MSNNRNKNQILNHASGVVIHGSSLYNVGRDQYNHCTVQQTIVHARQKKDKTGIHLPALSQFSEVKRGDIYKDPSGVCYSWRLCSNGRDDTDAAVYHAELNIAGPFGQKKFTVKTYRGRNAMKEWRRDFLRCSDSEDWCREVPLFGYNMSSVPLLIFCGELIPIAHLQVKAGMTVNLMQEYFDLLRNTLGCSANEIWMDPKNGKFCRGPVGPERWDPIGKIGSLSVPADVDFLQEGVLIRYLSNMEYDHGFLWALNYSSGYRYADFRFNHPQVISGFCNSTIAIHRKVSWTCHGACFDKKSKFHKLTRFNLKDDGHRDLEVRSADPSQTWLAQALSVFHAYGIQLDEDLSLYKHNYAYFKLRGTLKRSRSKQQRRWLCDPIYFFLDRCPFPDTHFYFWSHDPIGRNPLSPDMCKYLGLPFKLSLEVVYRQKRWPTKIYKALHDYQISRGFDPRTTNFAKFMGCPTLELVAENRFQELDDDKNNLPSGSKPKLGNTSRHLEAVPMDGTQGEGSDHFVKDVKRKPFRSFSAPFTRLRLKVKAKGEELLKRVRA